jgi:tellurite methyltransferase
MSKFYDEKYRAEDSYWGNLPSSMARIVFHKFLSDHHPTLLDIGCGEGRDSIFFAQNGFRVTGFDSSAEGIKKSGTRASELNLSINFFQADINQYHLQDYFDYLFSSGSLHYIPLDLRQETIDNYKQFTIEGGINAHMVPIIKPFVTPNPLDDDLEQDWRSGEILTYYWDWKVEFFTEEILDDNKSEYKYVVNRLVARKPSA